MILRKKIEKFTSSLSVTKSDDPDIALMEYMTKMMMFFLSAGCLPFSLLSLVAWFFGIIPADTVFLLFLMNSLFFAGLLLAKCGYWRFSSLIPPVIVYATAVYGNYIGGMDAPAMLIYVLAIILVAALRSIRDMYIAIALSLAAFISTGMAHRFGIITQLRTGQSHFWNRIIITGATITAISLLVRFLIIQFRNALNNARLEILERAAVEKALKVSEKNYRELVQNSNSIILRINMRGEITFCNKFAEKFFGYSIDEITGKHMVGTIVPETESSGRDLKQLMKELIKSPENFSSNENENITRDGRRVWVTWANKPVTDSDGNVTELLCIGNDITERRLALEEKERMQMQLFHAQKMEAIGTLTSGLAHDFNNILSGIMGSLSLLDMLLSKEIIQEKEKASRYINMAIKSSRRASDMIRQLLLLSRRQDITLTPVDINLCMEHVFDICSSSFPKSVLINVGYGPGPMIVMTDEILIEQILLNFCVNASHAMTIMKAPGEKEGGNLEIRISSEEHPPQRGGEQAGSFVRIDISDTGVGMDEETQKRIFEPFFTMKKKESGTGLGLSMAYGFISRIGGFIEMKSAPGKGSVFSIFLPEYTGELLHDGGNEKPKIMVTGKATLLLIDDETTILSVAEDTLKECGYTVLTAQDGIKGLSLFGRNPEGIDLVLLDISMPYMSGLEVFEKIRELNSSVKVLLSSGYSDDERVAEAMSMGASGFIQKPYTAGDLSRRIYEILNP
ncbi:MAG TPA: response regulator [Spirochaetota bacterium]|nr:response regulator [Spirochaetota bacterium]